MRGVTHRESECGRVYEIPNVSQLSHFSILSSHFSMCSQRRDSLISSLARIFSRPRVSSPSSPPLPTQLSSIHPGPDHESVSYRRTTIIIFLISIQSWLLLNHLSSVSGCPCTLLILLQFFSHILTHYDGTVSLLQSKSLDLPHLGQSWPDQEGISRSSLGPPFPFRCWVTSLTFYNSMPKLLLQRARITL